MLPLMSKILTSIGVKGIITSSDMTGGKRDVLSVRVALLDQWWFNTIKGSTTWRRRCQTNRVIGNPEKQEMPNKSIQDIIVLLTYSGNQDYPQVRRPLQT